MKKVLMMTWLLTCIGLPLSFTKGTPPEANLPNVLIIGDSISLGYTPYVTQMLKDVAAVKHHKGNAQHTGTGLALLDEWIGDTTWDVIHFNWGLWDLCYRHPQSKVQGHRDKVNGTVTTSLAQYEKNLDQLVTRLKKTHAKLIWAHTTVVPENEAGRFAGDDKKYNDAATKVMKKQGIPINELFALTRSFPPELFTQSGNVHYTQEGYQRIGRQVAEVIMATLAASSPSPQNLGAETRQTLSEIYQDAKQLAQTPGQNKQAIARYRSILDIHQANERVFEAALNELAKCYQDAGLTEEHIRSFLTLAYGVVEDAKPLVEAGLLTALPAETDEDARKTGFRALRLVATEKSRPFLRQVLASDMESDEYKQLAREILKDLDKGNEKSEN